MYNIKNISIELLKPCNHIARDFYYYFLISNPVSDKVRNSDVIKNKKQTKKQHRRQWQKANNRKRICGRCRHFAVHTPSVERRSCRNAGKWCAFASGWDEGVTAKTLIKTHVISWWSREAVRVNNSPPRSILVAGTKVGETAASGDCLESWRGWSSWETSYLPESTKRKNSIQFYFDSAFNNGLLLNTKQLHRI